MDMGGSGTFSDGGEGTEPTFPCANCGHRLPTGTPICGNCGTIVGGGGSGVPQPLAAQGIRPAAVMIAFAILALGVALFFARGAISDAVDSVTRVGEEGTGGTIEEPPIGTGGGKGGGGNGRGGKGGGATKGPVIAYRHVPQVVRDIRAGGVPCSSTSVDSSNAYVESGSCQSNGSHVQINLYFDPNAIASAREFYDDFAFASVHADNWWVSGETTLMARVQQAIGGRLHRP